MGVYFRTSQFIYEVGTSDFLISFFDTIKYRLTRRLFSRQYPTVLNEFYKGKLSYESLDKAEYELKDIQKRLKKFHPSKVIWDMNDLTKRPPWGDNISNDISDLSNYFVTSDGKDLFEVIFQIIDKAKTEKCEILIE